MTWFMEIWGCRPGSITFYLLSLVELIGLRSGHAYRAAHLNHHARFPHHDDVEGAAAHESFLAALLAGPLHQVRLTWWAMEHARRDRTWILIEIFGCALLVFCAVAAWPSTPIPMAWVLLVMLGGWTFPLITGYLPHSPEGTTALTQTRRFRGRIVNILFLRHMYHLEHHLYPAVPHQHWPKLAKRLDPFLDRAEVPAIYIGSDGHLGFRLLLMVRRSFSSIMARKLADSRRRFRRLVQSAFRSLVAYMISARSGSTR